MSRCRDTEIDFSPYHFPAHTATIARRRRASFRCSISIGGCTLAVYGSFFSDSRAYYRSYYRRFHAKARNEPENVRFRLRPQVFWIFGDFTGYCASIGALRVFQKPPRNGHFRRNSARITRIENRSESFTRNRNRPCRENHG